MSVWVDDGNSSCFTELQNAGFEGTYVTNDPVPSFYPQYYGAGMELGCHLFYHTCDAVTEYYLRYTQIEPNIAEICGGTPEPCPDLVSLVWPCGFTTIEEEAVSSNYYLAARGYNFNLLEETTPTDWQNLKSFNSHEHTPYPPSDLKTVVDMAVQQGKWANLVFHTSCNDDGAIAYSATKDIWVAPADTVIKYILQRQGFVLNSYQSDSSTTTFSYSRLGIPMSPFRDFETAFTPADTVTLQININGSNPLASVTLNGTSYPYKSSVEGGNTIVLMDVPIDKTVRTVTISSTAVPSIALTPADLNFSASVGTNPASQTISLSNGGGGTLSWTATADSTSPAWLSVSPGIGAGDATLSVSVNTSSLAAGNLYQGNHDSGDGGCKFPPGSECDADCKLHRFGFLCDGLRRRAVHGPLGGGISGGYGLFGWLKGFDHFSHQRHT
ncbi:MAG: hypothetical protein M0Z48_11660 [Nitrospiraceae bacterium]|nr:hypothetical protein [Nitrospiraceae bacterium]